MRHPRELEAHVPPDIVQHPEPPQADGEPEVVPRDPLQRRARRRGVAAQADPFEKAKFETSFSLYRLAQGLKPYS
jgi:hypothetical protein